MSNFHSRDISSLKYNYLRSVAPPCDDEGNHSGWSRLKKFQMLNLAALMLGRMKARQNDQAMVGSMQDRLQHDMAYGWKGLDQYVYRYRLTTLRH